ncbi:MAG TPA: DNRLRE domain-containing protein [Thermoanaerobaculia bacterium]|nr:DNRLRE domain-containing protein [Thermoanaerobaculia bacterium]
MRLYRAEGVLAATAPLAGVRFLAPDGHGGVWLATAMQLLHLGKTGRLIATARPFPPGDRIVALAADPGDVTAWVASRSAVVHVKASGHTLERVAFGKSLIRGLGIAPGPPDVTPPRLELPGFQDGSILTTATPRLRFRYSDAGSGVRRGSLIATADGATLALGCQESDQEADCTPATPLRAGTTILTAAVEDFAGNRSAPITVHLTVQRATAAASEPGAPTAATKTTSLRTVTLYASADSYLRQGARSQNVGQQNFLRVRSAGPNRALVRFDPAEIAAALAGGTLVSANLELRIQTNGANWSNGRTVDAHRLTADWTESGVTWDCPADTVPSNSHPDCAVAWNGGSFNAAPTATVLHTNNLTGWISFDLTSDIAAFATGTPNYGWLLKKTDEEQNGLVEYSSREMCRDEPRLVLVVEAAAPDSTPPRLDIVSPSERFLINRPTQPIQVHFFDAGSALDLNSLRVSLDGADLTATCAVCSTGAVCPWPILAEGSHTILAEIKDGGGHLATAGSGFDLLLGDGEHRITLPEVADTYLRSGAANQNQGSETLLRIRASGNNRALARFDLSGLQSAVQQLHSATLEMFVETNGGNWGSAGRTLDAHRLTADWSEAGATWNCAADAVPGNQNADCPASWGGGTFATAPTASVLQTNSLTGWVGYDVTADVQSQVAGAPHYGWLIKKRDETQNGLVEYGSREGTEGHAPRLVLVFDGGEPVDAVPPSLTITAPAEGATVRDATPAITFAYSDSGSGVNSATLAARVAGAPVPLACTFGGGTAECAPFDTLPDGPVSLTATIIDNAGNVSPPAAVHFTIDTGPQEPPLPPDPATVAPPLDLTVATDLAAATEFLYTGANPIQSGVAAGTIDPRRTAVLRGRILDRAGGALPGVEVAIHDHPELGHTRSRADGAFDLVVNGGGPLVVDYRKAGYLPAQRSLVAPARDYGFVDDVVLVPLDAVVTTILAGQPDLQVARGGTVTDDDGTRRATLLFPPGTTASMVLADGSVQPLSALSIRATEYSVGADGVKAMPAPLPPNTGYTYAVELSADEAVAAGATRVELSQPAVQYLENFLGFPVGGIVPVGFYDRGLAAWVPSENGRILRVLSIAGGMAALDVDGSGQPADASALEALGVTAAERQALAQLYVPGQSLWRVPIPHLTPWDCNWPYGPPPDAEPPPDPDQPDVDEDDDPGHDQPDDDSDDEDDNDCDQGSIIECQSQILREEIPLDGTPLRLHYDSDRMPGYGALQFRKLRVSGGSVPASLKGIEFEVAVAGRRVFSASYPASPNLVAKVSWDGKDAYGRIVQGSSPVTVTTIYRYGAVYYTPADFQQSFSRFPSGGPLEVGRSGSDIAVRRSFASSGRVLSRNVSHLDWREMGLGGWTLSVHHLYEPTRRALYPGYGGRHSADPLGHFLVNVAGTGNFGGGGDGGPARRGELAFPWGISRASDGSLYIADTGNHRIRRVAPDGTLSTVAGTGERCEGTPDSGGGEEDPPADSSDHCGAGGLALLARLTNPSGVAVAPDGRVYIADTGNGCVRKLESDGTLTTVAGSCEGEFAGGGQLTTKPQPSPKSLRGKSLSLCAGGDLCRATESSLEKPTSLAFDRDGGLYVTDERAGAVLFVGLDGWLSVVAGGGEPADGVGDGLPAREAFLLSPAGLAVTPEGMLLIADYGHSRVRQVGLDGIIRTVAGMGTSGLAGDGGPASAAQLDGPAGLAMAADGSYFIAEANNDRIRLVSPAGKISTFAGSGESSFSAVSPDGTPALGLALGRPLALALAPDGTLLFSDYYNMNVGSIATDLPGFTNEEILLSSEDGNEIYVFDPRGRHLRTVNAASGAAIYRFRYTPGGLLSEIEDAYGNLTRVERDAAGRPLAVVAPFGQRTRLVIGGDGYLASLSDPAGLRTYGFTYDRGLMKTRIDPRQNTYAYAYNILGRLIRDDDPAGGFKTLTRGGGTNPQNYTVAVETALGRHTEYRVSTNRTLQTRRTSGRLSPEGETEETVESIFGSGTRVTTQPSGTVVTTREGPDGAWGARDRRAEVREVRTPSGLTSTTLVEQGAELADPEDPFSVVNRFQNVTENGQTFSANYDGPTRTSTWQTPEGRIFTSQADEFGRLVTSQVSGLAPLSWQYDTAGRLSRLSQGSGDRERTTSYHYGPDGRLASVTDPLGRTVSLSYDALGRLEVQRHPGGREIRFGYDAADNLVSLTPPGRPAHSFQYTKVDQQSQYTPPDLGTGNVRTTFVHDVDRQVTQILRPDGRGIGIVYDVGGRPTGVTTHRGTTAITYRTGTRDPLTVTTPEGNRLSYAYDGHLLTSAAWSGEVNGSVQWLYDTGFRTREERVNGGQAMTFSYDRDGLLVGAGGLAVSRDATSGLLRATSLGSVTTALDYNEFGEPAAASAAFGASSLWQVQYLRDKLGRIVRKLETLGGVTNTYDYSYDLAGHLTRVEKNGALLAEYTYDPNGNRLSYDGTFGPAAASYDDQDRLLAYGDTSFAYTANGELLSKTQNGAAVVYGYDELGNLLSVGLPSGIAIDYVVDGRNRRIGKKINGTLVQGFLYRDLLKPVAELDGAGNVVSRFVYGSRSNVPDFMIRAGIVYRILSDHLGSPRLVINAATGGIAQQLDYDEFGRVILDTNPGFQPFGFAAGLYDRQTGLVRFGARDYDPATGRWTAKDPIRFAGGGTNLFGYAISDPINLVDPSGLVECTDQQNSFFSDLLGPVKKLAEKYNFDPNFLLGLSAHESGWMGQHARDLNNAFGLTRAGGNNLSYDSVQQAVDYWGQHFGEKVRGARSIDDFINRLQTDERDKGGTGKYNTVDPDWDKKVRGGYDAVKRRRGKCFCELPGGGGGS